MLFVFCLRCGPIRRAVPSLPLRRALHSLSALAPHNIYIVYILPNQPATVHKGRRARPIQNGSAQKDRRLRSPEAPENSRIPPLSELLTAAAWSAWC